MAIFIETDAGDAARYLHQTMPARAIGEELHSLQDGATVDERCPHLANVLASLSRHQSAHHVVVKSGAHDTVSDTTAVAVFRRLFAAFLEPPANGRTAGSNS